METWPTYHDTQLGLEFKYPPEYDADPHRDWSWTGDGGPGAEAHLISKGNGHTIHIVREPVEGRGCLLELCVAPVQKEVSKNGIAWEYLGEPGYCDVGQCAPARSAYRTNHNGSRYYLLFEKEQREDEVLSSLIFLN